MKKYMVSGVVVFLLLAVVLSVVAVAASGEGAGSSPESPSYFYTQLQDHIVGTWQERGELFTDLQKEKKFKVLFLLIITVIPVIFLLHLLVVGAMEFDHDGEQILFFGLLTRIVHWLGAISFSLLVVTGLFVIFGALFGGGGPIRAARYVHIGAALIFSPIAVCMFFIWVKDMLPKAHDIMWMVIVGGYLSKEKKPVPAGKFNAGQKMWFWLATVGGVAMAYTGYIIWGFGAELDTVRLYTIIHNCLAAAMIIFFLTHLYMSIFAIKGSLESMKTGYKPKDEVDILHSRFKY